MSDQLETCPACNGTGKVAYDIVPGAPPSDSETGVCARCAGSGRIPSPEKPQSN
jgi:DnaJ-class molecular chaperone